MLCFVGATQDFLRLTEKGSPCGGKLDGAFRAEQEFDAEFLFEVENGLADCGLCHVKAARSFAVVQILGYTHEVAEMAQFHRRHVIAKSDYYKQIIRFLRFQISCD